MEGLAMSVIIKRSTKNPALRKKTYPQVIFKKKKELLFMIFSIIISWEQYLYQI